MFQLNVLGPIALTRAALPFLLSRRKGRLVVVSSMAAAVPAPGQAVYSGTKLALHGYFATLQSELNDRQASDSSLAVVMPGELNSVMKPPPSIHVPQTWKAEQSLSQCKYGPQGRHSDHCMPWASGDWDRGRSSEYILFGGADGEAGGARRLKEAPEPRAGGGAHSARSVQPPGHVLDCQAPCAAAGCAAMITCHKHHSGVPNCGILVPGDIAQS